MNKSIDKMTKWNKAEFNTVKHDPSSHTDRAGKINDDQKLTEDFWVKEEMSIELKN